MVDGPRYGAARAPTSSSPRAPVTFAPGVTTQTVTIQIVGDTVFESDETFTVTLSNPVGPASIGDGLGVVTIVDNDPPPPATVTVTATNGGEGGSPVVVTFTRNGVTTSALTINVAKSGTSASGDVGTPTVSGGTFGGSTVTFAAGSSTVTLTYAVVDDNIVEGSETLIYTVNSGTGYVLGSPASATATIADNDAALPAVSVAVSNGAEGGANVVVTFTRTGSTTSSLVVTVARTGTSLAGDVTGPTVSGGSFNGTTTVTFAAGSSTVTLTYGVVDDSSSKVRETLIFTVQSGTGYTVGSPSSGTGHDCRQRRAPSSFGRGVERRRGWRQRGRDVHPYRFDDVEPGGHGGAHGDVARRRRDRSDACRVVRSTGRRTVTFAAGSSTVTLTYGVVDDTLVEGAETLIFTVQSGTGYTVGSPSSGTGTIADNDVAPVVPTLTISDMTVTEGNNGGAAVTATLTVTRTGDLSGTSTVNWTTSAISAVAGSDFTAAVRHADVHGRSGDEDDHDQRRRRQEGRADRDVRRRVDRPEWRQCHVRR